MKFDKLTLEIFASEPSHSPTACKFTSRCVMRIGPQEHVSESFGTLPVGPGCLEGVERLMDAHVRNFQRYFTKQG